MFDWKKYCECLKLNNQELLQNSDCLKLLTKDYYLQNSAIIYRCNKLGIGAAYDKDCIAFKKKSLCLNNKNNSGNKNNNGNKNNKGKKNNIVPIVLLGIVIFHII